MKIPLFRSKAGVHTISVCMFFACCIGVPVSVNAHEAQGVNVVQQQISVSGVVVDNQGNPIIGASVLEEKTSNGTITNLDGEFKLTVAAGSMLKITFIGYKDVLVKASDVKDLKIVLEEDTETLDEVVVWALVHRKK